MRELVTTFVATASLLLGAFASADTLHPPQGVLWSEEANGDATQNDLGFILPMTWKGFKREGFTATREDGASVKTYYVNDDKKIRLNILLQLRADAQGAVFSEDLVWDFMKMSADLEYARRTKAKAVELSSNTFSLGKRTPLGRTRWARFDMDDGAEMQGLWWQNIGLWSVVITISGPEARRAELEAHANTLLNDMPFPSAPLATELSLVGEKLLADMPKCREPPTSDTGKSLIPEFKEVAALNILMPGMVMGRANDVLISPYSNPKDYCVIETFNVRKDFPITALAYLGSGTSVWQARYGFVLNNGRGGYYQIERMPPSDALNTLLGDGAGHVYLNFSNNKRASIYTIFDGWPSYEDAKKEVSAIHAQAQNRPAPLMTMTHPAKGVMVVVSSDGYKKPE